MLKLGLRNGLIAPWKRRETDRQLTLSPSRRTPLLRAAPDVWWSVVVRPVTDQARIGVGKAGPRMRPVTYFRVLPNEHQLPATDSMRPFWSVKEEAENVGSEDDTKIRMQDQIGSQRGLSGSTQVGMAGRYDQSVAPLAGAQVGW